MKKLFPRINLVCKGSLWLALVLFIPVCWASLDLDRQYALEAIGVLRSTDNVDGLFSEYVSSAYQEYFSKQTRFILADLSKADAIFSESKIAYSNLVKDPDILRQLARVTRTDTLLRTGILKESNHYLVKLELLHVPQVEIVAEVEFVLDQPQEISKLIQSQLDRLFSQIPFIGHITGRDHAQATVNLGISKAIKKGDVLVIATLDEVKRHPLLRRVVDWKLSPIGKLQVEQVEDGMAFCKVIEENPEREMSRYQKVVQIQAEPPEPIDKESQALESLAQTSEHYSQPQIGYVSGSLIAGNQSWQMASVNSSSVFTNVGGGIAFGARTDVQVWLTRNWFAETGVGYSFWNFTQQDAQTGMMSAASQNGGVSGSDFSARIDLGYTYFVTRDFWGPKGFLKLGYKTHSYSLPQSTIEATGPSSVGSVFLGLGADLPFRQRWGLLAGFNFKLLSSGNVSWVQDSVSGVSDMEFSFGGYARLNSKVTARFTLEVIATGIDFSLGSSLSQKSVTIAPSLLYYF